MRRKLSLFFLSVLLILPAASYAQKGGVVSWAGNYLIDGGDYTIGVEVVETNGMYQVMRLLSEVTTAGVGVGLSISDTELAVAYKQSCVIQMFNVGADGTLSGPRAEAFVGISQETSTPIDGQGAAVGGTYAVSGTTPDGTGYFGTLEVTPAGENIYALAWTTGIGNFSGPAVLTNNRLIAAANTDPDISCSLNLLTMGADGSLSILWYYEGSTETYTETAMPIVLAPTYTLEGNNVDGTSYTGTLYFLGAASPYRIDLVLTGSPSIGGVALLRGNALIMAYGGDSCAVYASGLLDDGRLYTRIATRDSATIGIALETPDGETDGYLGLFNVVGTAASGGPMTGRHTISGGKDFVYSGSGAETRPTNNVNNIFSLDSIYLENRGMLMGVYAPAGIIDTCRVMANVVTPTGTLNQWYTQYGQTAILGGGTATPTQ
ncbi:MAG: hypothetical protein H7175_20745 [Burkholderiales bacterium]|nr:hypothetical protein [Anaerolineae bacterium]